MIEFLSLIVMCLTIHFYYTWSLEVGDSIIIGIFAYFISWVLMSLLWKK